MRKMKFKQTVINNKIVYANRFLRWGEAIWDFIDDHFIPWRIIYGLGNMKRCIRRGFQRMFYGYDETISWGTDSTIQFYKQLLSDLYKYAHGWPGSAKLMREICPEEWKEVEDKWMKKLPEGKTLDNLLNEGIEGIDTEEYSDDGFECWKKYIKRVLHYFEEADLESCSKRSHEKELYDMLKNPFEEKERKIIEHNGEFLSVYPSLGHSEEDEEQRRVLKELSEIDEYRAEQLKLGMAEIAKNIIYLND